MDKRIKNIYFHGSPYEKYLFSIGVKNRELVLKPENSDLIVLGHHPPDMDSYNLLKLFNKYEVPKVVLAHGAYSLHGLPSPSEIKTEAFHFQWMISPDVGDWLCFLIEDRLNAKHHIIEEHRRVLLLIEDEIPFASQFVPMMLKEIIERTKTLVDPYISESEKIKRVEKQRPILLLASTFEQAINFVEEYGDKLVGVISSLGFPRNGENDPRAGLALLSRVKSLPMEIPMVILSLRRDMKKEVEEAGAAFVSKFSPDLLHDLRKYLLDSFGFGDFIFKNPNTGNEVARARSLGELKSVLEWLPLESFVYHASRYHFSNWLALHGRLDLAEEIRPIPATEGEMSRKKLLRLLDLPIDNKIIID